MGPPLSELLLPEEGLDRVLRQGWELVPTGLSESPPPLVGATLNCLEVPLHAKGVKAAEEDQLAQLAAEGPQYGLFLFGGDDEHNQQTDTLMIFYLQENKWRHPSDKGRRPSKRSRHTANVISAGRGELLLIFGGVGATNAVSLLDPTSLEWKHPPSRSKPGEKEKAKRRAAKKKDVDVGAEDKPLSESLLPCARFGHSAAVVGKRMLLFGGADFKGPLGDLYQLDLDDLDNLEWSRPEAAGLPPPPSARHCCAVVRDHMLLISGETSWGGHMWALRLSPPMTWVRSTLPDFPLLGVSRHALVPYVTPRPYKREELLLFGGHLEAYGREESEILDAFFTLDFRTWRHEEAEIPREGWADIEARLIAAGKEETELENARKDWEEEMRRKQKEIARINRRKARRDRRKAKLAGTPMAQLEAEKEKKGRGRTGGASSAEEEDDEEEELSDEEAIAAREAEKEFELPPEMMPTVTFGEFVPLRIGRELPPPRFGHAMCLAGASIYVYGGRNSSISNPVLKDFHRFDGAPLEWKDIAYDGDGPGTRVSHTMVQLEHHLYVLGGGSGNRAFNDLHRLDLFTMHWELIHTQGDAPGAKPDALIGHTVEWVDPYMVVFAGGDGRRPSNDVHTLELRTATWHAVTTQGAPPAPRVGHSSSLIRDQMFVIGGFSKGKYFHDVHALNVESLQWAQLVVGGTAPHGRVSHSASLHQGAVHLFGGSAGGTCYNDYFVFTPVGGDDDAGGKKKLPGVAGGGILKGAGGKAKAAERGARAGAAGVWTNPEVAGFAPEPRYSHSATIMGHLLFIVGGLARKGKPIDDLHVLDLNERIWTMPRVTLEGPAPRGRHTACSIGSTLLIFGGGAKGEVYGDIWALDVDGRGLGRLEALAGKDGAREAGERRLAAEQAIPLSFLTPHMLMADGGAAALAQLGEYPPQLEYEDIEAKDADASEVRSWLTHLGLAHHAYTFEAHEIDFSVLLELQEHDLVDMRIDDPMQRLTLMTGIEVLRSRGALASVGRAPRERLFRERYRMGAEVNFGGHPAVLAVDCKTDLKVAVKFVSDMAEYHRQVSLLKELKGTLVVPRLADSFAALAPGQSAPGGAFDGELQRGWGLPCLVLEYGECSLADAMGRGLMPSVELKATFEALVRCVLSLHSRNLAHCALQPESFRLYEGSSWRLASLDSVRKLGEPTSPKCPVCYAAPEVIRSLRRGATASAPLMPAPSDAALDVWSLGVLLWQLYSQQPLYGSESEAFGMLPSLGNSLSGARGLGIEPSLGCVSDLQARHLLQKMLHRDPGARLPSSKVLKHGFLTGGLDTVQMESTFGPMQKGQLFMRTLLQQLEGLHRGRR